MLRNYDSLSKFFAETERSIGEESSDIRNVSKLSTSKPVLHKIIKQEVIEESKHSDSNWCSSPNKTSKCATIKKELPNETTQSSISAYFSSKEASTSKCPNNLVKIAALNEETCSFIQRNFENCKKETSKILPDEDEVTILSETNNCKPSICNMKKSDSWQIKKSTFTKKLVHIYFSGDLSDVVFRVSGIHEIKGHKLLFAMQSDVFENLFKIYQDNVVPIIDVPIEIFENIVKYVYMIPPVFKTKEDAKNTYAAAEKYNMIKLKRMCCKFLGTFLSLNNIFAEYEEALKADDYLMIEECKRFINRNLQKILQSKDFFQQSNFTIKNILNDRNPSPKDEVILFNAIKQWAIKKCDENQQEKTVKNLRNNMEKFLPYVRFLNMKNSDFISGPAQSKILNEQEITSIIMNIDVPGSTALPSWCNKTRDVQQTKRKRPKSCKNPVKKRVTKKQKRNKSA